MLKQGTFRNGNVIAVKKLSQMILDNDDRFQKEVNYLLNLNHQNIVQLIGYCAESKYVSVKLGERYVVAEEQQRLLCFEYLNNRSLREHISGMEMLEHALCPILLYSFIISNKILAIPFTSHTDTTT